MKLYSIETGSFKLDGGAMFGVVPKSIWNKLNPADNNNMIQLAMRCLLIEDGNRLILIDNGIGDKQDAKFFGYYFLNGDDSLEKSLNKHGFQLSDVTDMVLTHLHFDHCGGSIRWKPGKLGFKTTFPNATYWISSSQWNESQHPNAREKASFIKDNCWPIYESGQLKLVNPGNMIHSDIQFMFTQGHTQGMMHPIIRYKNKNVIYLADVIPTAAHIPIPYVMGYDVRPLDTMQEKSQILQDAAMNESILFFEHDPFIEACTVELSDKGIRMKEQFKLSEF